MRENLLLVGASVRAAAQSARRGGFAPLAVDLFADRDLRQVAATVRMRRYPSGMIAAIDALEAAQGVSAPLVYTGAMENYPSLVDALARRRTLLGNGGDVLRAVRDPFRVAASLSAAGIRVPDLRRSAEGLTQDGRWLRKPFRGAGGRGIVPWDVAIAGPLASVTQACHGGKPPRRAAERDFFQQRIEGESCAALFVAGRGGALLLGVTRQLIGAPWAGADGFRYAGSLGPLSLPASERESLTRIGARLAADFSLFGLFGVDVILRGDEVWPVEVNPRYPASAEVLERTLGFSAIDCHVAACRGKPLPAIGEATRPGERIAGKTILFARHGVEIPERLVAWAESLNAARAWPLVADLPEAGNRIAAGAPLLTVLADGTSLAEVEAVLKERTECVQQLVATPAVV